MPHMCTVPAQLQNDQSDHRSVAASADQGLLGVSWQEGMTAYWTCQKCQTCQKNLKEKANISVGQTIWTIHWIH